jgi:transcriptional regulator with XRE-family HTH domain
MPAPYKSNEEFEWGLYFGRNLQRMLHKKNIDQGYLARQLSSTDAMISRYVHGTSIPSVYKVSRIAEIIGCDISDLVKINYED